MDVGTEDLLIIITSIRDRLIEVEELMDVHQTHVNRMKVVAEKTHALVDRGSIELDEWVRVSDDQLRSVVACYEDFVKLSGIYADIADGISEGVGHLK